MSRLQNISSPVSCVLQPVTRATVSAKAKAGGAARSAQIAQITSWFMSWLWGFPCLYATCMRLALTAASASTLEVLLSQDVPRGARMQHNRKITQLQRRKKKEKSLKKKKKVKLTMRKKD